MNELLELIYCLGKYEKSLYGRESKVTLTADKQNEDIVEIRALVSKLHGYGRKLDANFYLTWIKFAEEKEKKRKFLQHVANAREELAEALLLFSEEE